MKKILSVLLALGLALCCLAGCGGEHTVNFDYNYITTATAPAAQVVSHKNKVEKPSDPTREGYKFLGWYSDETLSTPWNFEADGVTADTTLYAGWMSSGVRGEISEPAKADKDLAKKSPGAQEEAYEYKTFFLPAIDGIKQGYVGDTMPYYEDGTYYIYYLKEGGDSYNHSIYLTTTQDFVNYTERQEVILESDRGSAQDSWIGTGSVVKVGQKYYFFYTGHSGSANAEYGETIMVAEGTSLTSFTKKAGWQILPDVSLKQKRDFRDPQAYYDSETDEITLTVTASKDSVARILKYHLKGDLSGVTYDGVIFTNTVGNYYNLECSDTFKIGNKWYITYSAQDDSMFYASSDSRCGPYSAPVRMDGKLFYAAKSVSDGVNTYLVGWARRSESVSSTSDVKGWAGNVIAQKVLQKSDGGIYLAPIEYSSLMPTRRALATSGTALRVQSTGGYSYTDVCKCYERFILEGDFVYSGTGNFGLAFDYDGTESAYKTVALSPLDQAMKLAFNKGTTQITEIAVNLQANTPYSFCYVQEGSIGVMYLNGQAALTVRVYGCSGKNVKFFADNNNVYFSSLRLYT